jgi:hypothetical protein
MRKLAIGLLENPRSMRCMCERYCYRPRWRYRSMVRYVGFLSNLLLPSYMPGRFRDIEQPIEGRLRHCIRMPMVEIRIYDQSCPLAMNSPSKDITIWLLSSRALAFGCYVRIRQIILFEGTGHSRHIKDQDHSSSRWCRLRPACSSIIK